MPKRSMIEMPRVFRFDVGSSSHTVSLKAPASRQAVSSIAYCRSLGGPTENVQSSFQQGRLGVKDLLDAHRDLYDAEVQQLEADIRCHTAAAKVEALTA